MIGFWAPFLAADLGHFFGGALSSFWIARGWPIGQARRSVIGIFGPSMVLLILTTFTSNYLLLMLLFAYATFAYAACGTMFLSMPADTFHTRAVASVSGLGGTGADIGTLVSTYLIGRISDRFSFQPILIAASLMPLVATVIRVVMVQRGGKPDPEGLLVQF